MNAPSEGDELIPYYVTWGVLVVSALLVGTLLLPVSLSKERGYTADEARVHQQIAVTSLLTVAGVLGIQWGLIYVQAVDPYANPTWFVFVDVVLGAGGLATMLLYKPARFRAG